ncbi:hypothetical protein J6590_108070, partial [Homalodisca vitripennis]
MNSSAPSTLNVTLCSIVSFMHKCKGRSTSVSSKSNIQTPVKIGLTSNCDNELKTMIASLTSKVEGFESILKEVKDSQNFIS